MTEISFFVAGHPVPTPRPRVTRFGVHYSKRYKDWLNSIRTVASFAGENIIEQPVMVTMRFVTPRYTTADIDNLVKAVLDGLEGCLIVNDRQVTAIAATKHQRRKDDPAGVHVQINTFGSLPFIGGGT